MSKSTIDKKIACEFCRKLKRESAMIYIVRAGSNGTYYCSQKCVDLANKLVRPHIKGRI